MVLDICAICCVCSAIIVFKFLNSRSKPATSPELPLLSSIDDDDAGAGAVLVASAVAAVVCVGTGIPCLVDVDVGAGWSSGSGGGCTGLSGSIISCFGSAGVEPPTSSSTTSAGTDFVAIRSVGF